MLWGFGLAKVSAVHSGFSDKLSFWNTDNFNVLLQNKEERNIYIIYKCSHGKMFAYFLLDMLKYISDSEEETGLLHQF